MTAPREPVRARLLLVREDARLTQVELADRLNAASAALYGTGGPRYRQSLVTKLETGMQMPSFEDIEVYATIDPQRRGKLWLAWNEQVDATRRLTDEDLAAELEASLPATAPTTEEFIAGEKRRQAASKAARRSGKDRTG